MLNRIGKLALKTLLSGNGCFERSRVIKDVGPEAFDYGLLIGHEDSMLLRDETADIFITCLHVGIEEFLGALYFLLFLDTGETPIGDKHLKLLKRRSFLSS